MVKNLPAMQETLVQSLSCEDPLEEEMATHSSFRAWEIPWTEEHGGLRSRGWQRVRHNLTTKQHCVNDYYGLNLVPQIHMLKSSSLEP